MLKRIGIEKSCVLQDPANTGRMIRCQQQDLSSSPIQALLKDGCEVNQLALSWKNQVAFVLKNDLLLQSVKFQDAVLELAKEDAENQQERFDADFIIMTATLSCLLADLTKVLFKRQ
jgi:recombination associated protein RdgC